MTSSPRPIPSPRRGAFTFLLGLAAVLSAVLIWAGLCAWALRQLGHLAGLVG